MANAKRVIRTEEKITEVRVDGIQLDLSISEAKALSIILACIGGDPVNSGRKYAASILDAVQSAGVCWKDVKKSEETIASKGFFFPSDGLPASLYFKGFDETGEF